MEARSRCWLVKFPWTKEEITTGDLPSGLDLVHAKVVHGIGRCKAFLKFGSLKNELQVIKIIPSTDASVEISSWASYAPFKDEPFDSQIIVEPVDGSSTSKSRKRELPVNPNGVGDSDQDELQMFIDELVQGRKRPRCNCIQRIKNALDGSTP